MTGQTHLYCGLATAGVITVTTGFLGVHHTDIPTFIGYLVGVSFGAILPDVDQPKSKVNNIFPFNIISFTLRHIGRIKHRGLTHSLLFLLCLIIITALTLVTGIPILIGFCCGMVIGDMTHLFLDCLNEKGCQLFFPLPQKIHIASIKYNGFIEHSMRLCGFAICCIAIIFSVLYR